MTVVSKTEAALRIIGDAFDRDAISTPLGAPPTSRASKGETTLSKVGID
jgi:hypothetical protein